MLAFGRLSIAGLTSRLLAWPRGHIRWKIILPYAFLVLVLAGAGTYLTTRLITSSLGDRFDNQLVEASRVASDAVVRKEREHLETVRAIAFTEGIADAVQAGDQARVGGLVEGVATNAAVERLEVLNSQGQRLKTLFLSDPERLVYQEINDGDNPADWPLVQNVFQGRTDSTGDKQAQIVQTSGGFVLYTAAPIVKDGQLVGTVLVGTPLDSLVRQMKREALADITIYDFEGNALGSTFVQPEGASQEEANLHVDEGILGGVGAADSVREHRTLWGREYDLAYGQLIVRDQIVGFYSVGLATDFIFDAGSSTRWQMALLFGLGMAAVLGVGLYLARTITEPILRLVQTAQLVTEGDFTARTEVRTTDEVGQLATSINQMTEKLQGQYLATLKALASAVAGGDPYTLGHSLRVGQLALMLGQSLALDDKTLAQLEIGGYLHDIGKIGIRDSVSLKPEELRAEERSLIEDHPHIGLSLPEPADIQKPVMEFVGDQQERSEDRSSLQTLLNERTSIVSRIVAVADMYDALTSERPDIRPVKPEEALALLRTRAGVSLHYGVVEKLTVIIPEWERRRGRKAEPLGISSLPSYAPRGH